jgi:hypothetical protein
VIAKNLKSEHSCKQAYQAFGNAIVAVFLKKIKFFVAKN